MGVTTADWAGDVYSAFYSRLTSTGNGVEDIVTPTRGKTEFVFAYETGQDFISREATRFPIILLMSPTGEMRNASINGRREIDDASISIKVWAESSADLKEIMDNVISCLEQGEDSYFRKIEGIGNMTFRRRAPINETVGATRKRVHSQVLEVGFRW